MTFRYIRPGPVYSISIHTALAGCDLTALETKFVPGIFQSTQPSQAVTKKLIDNMIGFVISIHTALAGCDKKTVYPGFQVDDFNPHSPRRL